VGYDAVLEKIIYMAYIPENNDDLIKYRFFYNMILDLHCKM
jgi:hypothetical protein